MLAITVEYRDLDPLREEFTLRDAGLRLVLRRHLVIAHHLQHAFPRLEIGQSVRGALPAVQRHIAFVFSVPLALVTAVIQQRNDACVERRGRRRDRIAFCFPLNGKTPDAVQQIVQPLASANRMRIARRPIMLIVSVRRSRLSFIDEAMLVQ
jgi:hypothetical protein